MTDQVPHMVQPERRLSRRVIIFWRSLRRNREIPAMQDFRPERLPVAWPRCFLLEVDDHRQDPVFDYVGNELQLDGEGELVGRTASTIPADTLLQRACRHWQSCCDSGLPVLVSGGFRHRAGHLVLHRSVLLPFGRNPRTVDYVVGATSHRKAHDGLDEIESETAQTIADAAG